MDSVITLTAAQAIVTALLIWVAGVCLGAWWVAHVFGGLLRDGE